MQKEILAVDYIANTKRELEILKGIECEINTLIQIEQYSNLKNGLTDYESIGLVIYEKRMRVEQALKLAINFSLKNLN
jgi:hypothetical protein